MIGRCATQQRRFVPSLCRSWLQTLLSVHHRGMALQIKVHCLGRLILLRDLLLRQVAPRFLTQPLSTGLVVFGIRGRAGHLAGVATQSQGKVFCGSRI